MNCLAYVQFEKITLDHDRRIFINSLQANGCLQDYHLRHWQVRNVAEEEDIRPKRQTGSGLVIQNRPG
uniref:Uncharacterized protein n=1 Tax=Lepeophtheirus salmonis TaxID=72036 RepID=A0A0K2UDW9_LEPSM